MSHKVLLGEMSWVEAERMFQKCRVVIVATGATEQHGPHLPLEHDSLTVSYIAKRAAERVHPKAIVCMPTTLGTSPEHVDYPGTLTLRYDVFIEILLDVCKSFKRHGLTHFLFLNGHGSNGPPLQMAARRAKDELGVDASLMHYWNLIPRELCAKLLGDWVQYPDHAGEYETSTALFTHPELVHLEEYESYAQKAPPRLDKAEKFSSAHKLTQIDPRAYAINYATMNFVEVTTNGVMPIGGKVLNARRENGQQMLEAAITGLSELIERNY